MEQYISKSALVAEIERRRDAALMRQQNLEAIGQETVLNEMIANELNKIISLIDTLEVKEVDNVWHDANETPKGAGDKEILVQFSDWHTSVLEIDDWEYLDHQTKWAYLKDLI